jgi:hypothetical protein
MEPEYKLFLYSTEDKSDSEKIEEWLLLKEK